MTSLLPSAGAALGNEAAIDEGVGKFNGSLDPPRLFSPQPLLTGLLGTTGLGSPHLFCMEEHMSLTQFLDGPPELDQLAHVSPQHTPGSPETMPLVPVSPHLEVGWIERTPTVPVSPQPTSEPPETGICDVPPPVLHNLKVYSRRKVLTGQMHDNQRGSTTGMMDAMVCNLVPDDVLNRVLDLWPLLRLIWP